MDCLQRPKRYVNFKGYVKASLCLGFDVGGFKVIKNKKIFWASPLVDIFLNQP